MVAADLPSRTCRPHRKPKLPPSTCNSAWRGFAQSSRRVNRAGARLDANPRMPASPAVRGGTIIGREVLLMIDKESPPAHFSTFPRTQPPLHFVPLVVAAFRAHGVSIGTTALAKGLSSDAVMSVLRDDLCKLGFEIEAGKTTAAKLKRPVFFGQDGRPSRQYEIDGFHPAWRCGIEIEAGRAWMGNAVYRDLVQAMVMVDLDHLILAVPMAYKYMSGGRLRNSSQRCPLRRGWHPTPSAHC